MTGTAALAAAGFASLARAASIKPYSWDLNPPTDTRDNFIAWGKARGEDPVFLGQRWDRFQALFKNKDIWGDGTIRAFLMTPREEFASVNPAIQSGPMSTPSSISAGASPCPAPICRRA